MNQKEILITERQDSPSKPLAEICNYQKGREFEDYVERLFNKESGRFIPVKHDTQSALIFGVPAARAAFPDLKFLFTTKKGKYKFAIECKWRKNFGAGLIKWAENYQLNNYNRFQKDWNIPVFVAIGIGGTPSNPDRLFVTPLHIIGDNTHVAEKGLLIYNRNKNRRFFYDVRQLKLF